MIRGPKKAVSVSMPLELYEKVKEQAERSDRSMPGYIRQVLKKYLWHVENAPESLGDGWEIR